MKWLINLMHPMLRYYRYKSKPDPFSKFTEIITSDQPHKSSQSGKKVLMFPLRVDPTSNTFEGVLGYALKERDYSVKAVMCGQAVNVCENINRDKNFLLHCSLCKSEQKRFSDSFGIDSLDINSCLSSEKKKSLRFESKRIELNEIFSYCYDGIAIGQHVRHGVLRHLLMSNIDLVENETIIREFLYTAMVVAESTRLLLRKHRPEFVILSHGIYSTWGTVLEVCKTDGYRAIVWGRGYVGQGSIQAAHNNACMFDLITESCTEWENTIVSDLEKKEIDEYFSDKKNPNSTVDHVNYYSEVVQRKIDIFEQLQLRKHSTKIGVFPNIPWDGTMFCATEDFPDVNAFVRSLIKWSVLNPHIDIIIRCHPAESFRTGDLSMETFLDILHMECDQLPFNIKIIEPTSSISSYEVSAICSAAVMYASSVALEFAYDFQPVIQAGVNNVSNKGFIFDATTENDLFHFLDKASVKELQMTDDMKKRVVQYAHYFVKKRHIPENLLELSHLAFNGYKFNSKDELMPGKNRMLDFFIDCCEHNKPFVWPDSDA